MLSKGCSLWPDNYSNDMHLWLQTVLSTTVRKDTVLHDQNKYNNVTIYIRSGKKSRIRVQCTQTPLIQRPLYLGPPKQLHCTPPDVSGVRTKERSEPTIDNALIRECSPLPIDAKLFRQHNVAWYHTLVWEEGKARFSPPNGIETIGNNEDSKIRVKSTNTCTVMQQHRWYVQRIIIVCVIWNLFSLVTL